MAAAASPRLSRLFLSRQPHSGPRPLPDSDHATPKPKSAASRLSRLFLPRQPHSGGRPFPDSKPATPIPKASRRPPNRNPRPDATLNPKASGDGSTSSTSETTPALRRLSRAAISIIAEPDLDRAVTLFKECSSSRKFRQDPRIFDLAVRRFAAAGRLDGVAEILEAQKAYPQDFSNEGFVARIISLYGTAGMPDHAVATYRELPALGLPPSIRCLNTLLNALVGCDEPARAFEVFRDEFPSVAPTASTYNVLAHAAMKMGDLDTAMTLMLKIQEENMEHATVTFNTILNKLCKAGRLDDADKFWASMAELGVEPDVMTFNARLRSLVAGGRIQEARDLLIEMTSKGAHQPDAYSYAALIDAYGKNGDINEAKKLFEEMSNRGCAPNQWTYQALVPRLCEAGELDLAFQLCRASIKNSCCVYVEVLVRVTDALVANRRLVEARELLKTARSKNYYRNNLNALAEAEERAAKVVDIAISV